MGVCREVSGAGDGIRREWVLEAKLQRIVAEDDRLFEIHWHLIFQNEERQSQAPTAASKPDDDAFMAASPGRRNLVSRMTALATPLLHFRLITRSATSSTA